MTQGLFIIKADAPYDAPVAPILEGHRHYNNVTLHWKNVNNARGYKVERSYRWTDFVVVAEHLIDLKFIDNLLAQATWSTKLLYCCEL